MNMKMIAGTHAVLEVAKIEILRLNVVGHELAMALTDLLAAVDPPDSCACDGTGECAYHRAERVVWGAKERNLNSNKQSEQ